MITEKEFLELLTDKLIEVAHNPKLRKEFRVSYDEGFDITSIVFYKNEPLMSEIEEQSASYGKCNYRDQDRLRAGLDLLPDLFSVVLCGLCDRRRQRCAGRIRGKALGKRNGIRRAAGYDRGYRFYTDCAGQSFEGGYHSQMGDRLGDHNCRHQMREYRKRRFPVQTVRFRTYSDEQDLRRAAVCCSALYREAAVAVDCDPARRNMRRGDLCRRSGGTLYPYRERKEVKKHEKHRGRV